MLRLSSVSSPSRWFPLWLAAAFAAVSIIVVANSPDASIYDEHYFTDYIKDLSEKGFGLAYLRELKGFPGPLVAILQQPVTVFTGLDIVPLRLANLAMFMLAGLALLLCLQRAGSENAAAAPALLFAIPFAGTSIGLMLTEAPALLVVSLGVGALIWGLALIEIEGEQGRRGIGWVAAVLLALGGLLLGGGVWGRQNYLVALVCLPVLFLSRRSFCWRPWILSTACMVLVSVALFFAWGGFVPAWASHELVVRVPKDSGWEVFGLNPLTLLRGLGYSAVAFAILAPRVFLVNRWCIALALVAALTLTVWIAELRFLPSQYILQNFIGDSVIVVLSVLMGSSFAFLGLWLTLSIAGHCVGMIYQGIATNQSNPPTLSVLCRSIIASPWSLGTRLYLFCCMVWVALLASNMANTSQFSSRYIFVAAPFIVVIAAAHFVPTWTGFARLSIGFVASLIFLIKKYEWL